MLKIDMEMPMTCQQCRFYDDINYDGSWCLAKIKEICVNSLEERDTKCPLIKCGVNPQVISN